MLIRESTVRAGAQRWFCRSAGSESGPPVLLLHGLPSHSHGWREAVPVLAERGLRVIAADWVGFGGSDKPDKSAFNYTPDAFIAALAAFVEALALERFSLVVQGFLGSAGIQYALREPRRIARLAVINAPISTSAKLPWNLRQLGLPLVGEMLTQNPLSVDQTLEGGGYTVISNGDLGAFRRPYSESGDAGRALMLTVRNLDLPRAIAEIEAGLAPWRQNGQVPTPFALALIWGLRDRYLGEAMAKSFVAAHPQVEFFPVAQAGHYPLEQDPEAVNQALVRFVAQPR
ncbi:MAG: alpha/beta fold hydrolase [Aphanocapsa lilacina HA4352-LM1]|nr:alpha/beta fold hydrolase [Aphanocapsa lilacina HA4352-LM1]